MSEPEKQHWTRRAKTEIDKTLAFIADYTPKLLKAGTTLLIFGYAGSKIIASAFPEAGLVGDATAYIAATIPHLKDAYQSITDMKIDDEGSANTEDVESLTNEIARLNDENNEYEATVRALQAQLKSQNDLNKQLVSAMETQGSALTTLLGTHDAMVKGHEQSRANQEQARAANSLLQNTLINNALANGEIIKTPFNPDKDSFVGYIDTNDIEPIESEHFEMIEDDEDYHRPS